MLTKRFSIVWTSFYFLHLYQFFMVWSLPTSCFAIKRIQKYVCSVLLSLLSLGILHLIYFSSYTRNFNTHSALNPIHGSSRIHQLYFTYLASFLSFWTLANVDSISLWFVFAVIPFFFLQSCFIFLKELNLHYLNWLILVKYFLFLSENIFLLPLSIEDRFLGCHCFFSGC